MNRINKLFIVCDTMYHRFNKFMIGKLLYKSNFDLRIIYCHFYKTTYLYDNINHYYNYRKSCIGLHKVNIINNTKLIYYSY